MFTYICDVINYTLNKGTAMNNFNINDRVLAVDAHGLQNSITWQLGTGIVTDTEWIEEEAGRKVRKVEVYWTGKECTGSWDVEYLTIAY